MSRKQSVQLQHNSIEAPLQVPNLVLQQKYTSACPTALCCNHTQAARVPLAGSTAWLHYCLLILIMQMQHAKQYCALKLYVQK